MGLQSKSYWLFLICFSVMIPFNSIEASFDISHQNSHKSSQSDTNLYIGQAQMDFHILSTGDYRCYFHLELVGNNQTAAGLGKGKFSIPTMQITNFSFTISSIVIAESIENNCSIFRFNISDSIPEGVTSNLDGSFSGTLNENASGLYTYNFGINWGAIVGFQNVKIWFNGQQFTKVSVGPTESLLRSTGNSMIILEWNEVLTQDFTCVLVLQPQESSLSSILVDLIQWNATVGQNIEVSIKNVGFYEIEGYVLLSNSSWIYTNTSKFTLEPLEVITVLLSISNMIIPGTNGSIEIQYITWMNREAKIFYFAPSIIVPVNVVEGSIFHEQNNNQLFNQFLLLGLISIIFISSIIIFYQREEIKLMFNKKINSLKKDSYNLNTSHEKTNSIMNKVTDTERKSKAADWNVLHSRWNTILPEQEMKLLEILFMNGRMNQQALADELGVSKGTISRVISRLESKKLLFRERFGISKLISLNKDRFQ
ncbi:MAG: helix-turn-helix transcriptional regulator [Candidatus Hodarchaeales archaeon]